MTTVAGPTSVVHPIDQLEGQAIGRVRISVPVLVPADDPSARAFELVLTDRAGDFAPAVVRGVHRRGAGETPTTVDVTDYRPTVRCGHRAIGLREESLEARLLRVLGSLLPPGGRLSVGCDGAAHRATVLALRRRVPPVLTALGRSLFAAGFPRVDYLDRWHGALQHERALSVEQPRDAVTARRWLEGTLREVQRFVEAPAEGLEAEPYLQLGWAMLPVLQTGLLPALQTGTVARAKASRP